jgi:hypothetical protein
LAFGIEIDKDTVRRILSLHTGQNRIRLGLPGSPFSATPGTACGAATYSAASPPS